MTSQWFRPLVWHLDNVPWLALAIERQDFRAIGLAVAIMAAVIILYARRPPESGPNSQSSR
jgi:hypothetical protein